MSPGSQCGLKRERDLLPELHADGRTVRAREPSEQVVEAPVLHHHVDHALDRPPRLGRDRRRRGGRGDDRLLASTAGARVHRRSRQRERGRPQERTPREQRRVVVPEAPVAGAGVVRRGVWFAHGCPSYQATPRTISFPDFRPHASAQVLHSRDRRRGRRALARRVHRRCGTRCAVDHVCGHAHLGDRPDRVAHTSRAPRRAARDPGPRGRRLPERMGDAEAGLRSVRGSRSG